MRVSDKMFFQKILSNVNKNRERMYNLQEQAASQKRINKLSDDPLGASRSLSAKEEIKEAQQYGKTINYALSFLKTTDQSLEELSGLLLLTKNLALSQANDPTASAEARKLTSERVSYMAQHVLQIGNKKFGDRFIFGGFNTLTPSFDREGVYHGDSGEIFVALGKGIFMPMNLTGEAVFGTTPFDAKNKDADRKEEASSSHAIRQDNKESILSVLKSLEIALRTNDKEGLRNTIDPLDRLISRTILLRSQLGMRISRLQSLSEGTQKLEINNKELISKMEDVDLFQLVNDINQAENTLKATLDSASRLVSKNLMDYLR